MALHPLDEARNRLLEEVDSVKRGVLESKIHLIRLTRDERANADAGRIAQEHTARGVLRSSSTLQRSWEAALTQAKIATETILDACFDVGLLDDERITAFAKEDLRHFLSSFMMSRFGHGDAYAVKAVQQYAAQAEMRASRVPHEVQSRRFDYGKKHPPNDSLEPQPPASVERTKQQKFGILDAPNLLPQDLSESAGILGRVLIYLDVDNFKAVNTKFTERVVDRTILPELHRLVRRIATGIGYAYAEGGDEMIVLLPNATLEMGVAVAHALRSHVEACPFQVDVETVRLRLSLGVAASNSLAGEALADLANQAKQYAKLNGKNCVTVVGPGGPVIASNVAVAPA